MIAAFQIEMSELDKQIEALKAKKSEIREIDTGIGPHLDAITGYCQKFPTRRETILEAFCESQGIVITKFKKPSSIKKPPAYQVGDRVFVIDASFGVGDEIFTIQKLKRKSGTWRFSLANDEGEIVGDFPASKLLDASGEEEEDETDKNAKILEELQKKNPQLFALVNEAIAVVTRLNVFEIVTVECPSSDTCRISVKAFSASQQEEEKTYGFSCHLSDKEGAIIQASLLSEDYQHIEEELTVIAQYRGEPVPASGFKVGDRVRRLTTALLGTIEKVEPERGSYFCSDEGLAGWYSNSHEFVLIQRQSQEQSQGQPQGDTQEQPQGDTQEQLQGNSQGQSQETSQEQPQGDSQEQPQETSQEQPQGDSQEQPQGDSQEQPQEQSQEQPQEQPQGDSQEQPQGDSQEQPQEQSQGDSQEQPQGDSQEQPQGDSQEQPQETSPTNENALIDASPLPPSNDAGQATIDGNSTAEEKGAEAVNNTETKIIQYFKKYLQYPAQALSVYGINSQLESVEKVSDKTIFIVPTDLNEGTWVFSTTKKLSLEDVKDLGQIDLLHTSELGFHLGFSREIERVLGLMATNSGGIFFNAEEGIATMMALNEIERLIKDAAWISASKCEIDGKKLKFGLEDFSRGYELEILDVRKKTYAISATAADAVFALMLKKTIEESTGFTCQGTIAAAPSPEPPVRPEGYIKGDGIKIKVKHLTHEDIINDRLPAKSKYTLAEWRAFLVAMQPETEDTLSISYKNKTAIISRIVSLYQELNGYEAPEYETEKEYLDRIHREAGIEDEDNFYHPAEREDYNLDANDGQMDLFAG